ncbi:MAG: T9SS type A sorting domain-containing protein [Bacteroidales bacterium]|jgi:hypothetical protein|nr:T9SS type A sorting domain-containing protein [Bacteroidales bacterium]
MKKTLILLSLSFFAVFSVFGQKSALHNEILQAKELNVTFENAVLYEASTEMNVLNHFINPNEISFLGNISVDVKNNDIKAMNLVLSLKNKNLTLELVEAPEYFYEYEIRDENGVTFPVNRDIKHYRGIVKNDYNSVVAITICEDEIMGLICTEEGNFNIAKDSASGKHIFYNETNLKEKTDPVYNPPVDNNSVSYDPEVLLRERTVFNEDGRMIIDPALNKIVKIYVETRYNIYIRHGSSVKNVEKNILGMFNQVAALFLNEDLHVGVLCLCIHRSADPYPYNGKPCTMLKKFQQETTSIMGANLGILLSYRVGGSDQYKGGCSALDGLCTPTITDKLAAVNMDKQYETVPVYSTSIHLITHEMGHLLGSYDTHACVWHNVNDCAPLDGCNVPDEEFYVPYGNVCKICNPHFPFELYPPKCGTIMSYCHLPAVPGYDRPGVQFVNGFGPQPGNVIRESVRKATCLECLTPENITNQTITNNCTIIGCERLNFQNVTITNNATVQIFAGGEVRLKSGFHATAGTNVRIRVGSSFKDKAPQSSMVFINNNTPFEEPDLQNVETNNADIETNPSFSIIPNPNPGTFKLETNFLLSDIANLKIVNLFGVSVYETKNQTSNTVQLQNAAPGQYFVVMILKDGTVLTQKMVVQR